jgi:hypothetical protein
VDRTIHQLLVAQAAGDPLTPAELERLADHDHALRRALTGLRPSAEFEPLKQQILGALDQLDAPELRALVRALVANLELVDTQSARAEGQRHRNRRDKRRGGQRSGAARRETAASVLADIEDMKAANPALSDKAAARRYLRDSDGTWDDEKVTNLVQRLRRARQKKRSRT